MPRMLRLLERSVEWLSYGTLACLIAVSFIQIVCRYIFNSALSWPEEVGRYLFVAVAFLGAALTMRRGGHLRVDILLTYASPQVKRALNTLTYACSAAYCSVCTWISLEMVFEIKDMGQTATSIDLPVYLTWIPIPLGCLLMTVYALLHVYALVSGSTLLSDSRADYL